MASVRGDIPTGTVTLLFTDVEGSTKLLQELGPEGYAAALMLHRRLLRDAFAAHDGVEVDTEGDSFFVAFPDPGEALHAAREAQEALRSGPILVRMGLHTGTPYRTSEGYVGIDVHQGARLAAAAHGGQIVLSRATRVLLDESFGLTDLGAHRVKDFAAPVWIYQLGGERFPPLKTISNTNLPRPASSFVGRAREMAEIGALLRDGSRLVTLTGPGGTGKTRLALEAAADLVPAFRNGVFWVDLAALRNPALVLDAIGQSVGAKEDLGAHIGEGEMLLLLDNLEQVVAAAPELAALVEACPRLCLLATSRERLRVRGEVEYPVPPLADAEAVELFCDRANSKPDETTLRLCRRLDDLPLAVELAAARTNVLSPAQILERLAERLDLLEGGRDAVTRQATLRATIEWSHDLLSPQERALFARLSVFRGGWTLEAAEEVCEADLDVLASLADKSLVRRTEARFAMLETIREFAAERLVAAGQLDELRHRHAAWGLALVAEAEPHLRLDEIEWLDRLEGEHDNLRAALDRLEVAGDTQAVLALSGGLQRFWYLKTHLAEGRRRLANALAADERPTAARASALRGASVMALNLGDTATARAWAEQALELDRRLGDAWGEGYSVMMIANSLGEEHELAAAQPLFEQAVATFETLGDELYALIAQFNLAWVTEELGDKARGRALHEDVLRRARAIGNPRLEAGALVQLAFHARDEGRLDQAVAMFREAIRVDHARGQTLELGIDLGRLANALVRMGRALEAARLLGASAALTESIGKARAWWDVRRNDETLDLLRQQLSETDQQAAMDEGRRLTIDEAVALALAG